MAGEQTRYIHGTSPEEQQRLSLLNDILNQECLRVYQLKAGEKILDVGSGLGQLSRAMARVTGARVVGIEANDAQRATAQKLAREAGEEALAEFRAGNAMQLDLPAAEWGAFDAAHTRFLLEHVPDPQSVVNSMLRAVRPGGRILLLDDDHDLLRLWPEPAGIARAWQAYYQTYARLGNDPFIGRKLAELLARAGARPVRIAWAAFGACAGDEKFPLYVSNLAGVLDGARGAITEAGLLDDAALDAALAALGEWGRRNDAAFWYVLPFAEGVKV